MCGIAGILRPAPGLDGPTLVARMTRAMRHRGPDDEGLWNGADGSLGMRRLSIIDLPGGHQPMWTENGIGIVFNGEIYNYRALREELRIRGCTFRTRSDTEVVLRLYQVDGLAGIDRLQGMFGLCIYDPTQRVAHLVRDRVGVKPLYYLDHPSGFYFASEINAILAGLERRPELDLQAVHDYLTLRYVPAPRSIWEGIRKLAPGSSLTFSLETGATIVERYWSVDFVSEPEDPTRDYAREFTELITSSVEKRLLAADVPVGVLLSGGLDSSVLSAVAVELGHRDFHTFSVGFQDDDAFDELPYARTMAEHLGCRHHEVTLDRAEFLDLLPEVVGGSDEPLADLAMIPLHAVSHLARRDVKVVLSGEGSDEVLAGYDLDRVAASLGRLESLDRFVPHRARHLAPLLRTARLDRAAAFAEGGWSGYFRNRRTMISRHWTETEKRALWSGREMRSTDDLIASWYDEARSRHPLDQLQDVYCRTWLVDDLLMKADRMSMASSLELRVPFLDHELVEWAAKLPLSWKVGDRTRGFSSKRVLREFARSRLPAEIADRPKQGFPVPAYAWLRGETGGVAARRLAADAGGPLAELLDLRSVGPVVDAARGGDLGAAHRVWVLLVLQAWLEHRR